MKDLVTAHPPTSIPGGLNECNHFALRLGRIWWVFSAGVRSALGSHPVWGCYMGRTGRLMLCCAQTRTWHLCCLPPTGTFIGEMTLHYTFSLVINTAIEPTELLHNITRIHNITRLHFPAGLRACVWTPLIPDSKEWNMTLLSPFELSESVGVSNFIVIILETLTLFLKMHL